jgi:hypothetical protein
MTEKELGKFLDEHKHIEYCEFEEDDYMCFRNTDLAWYKNNPESSTAIKYWKLAQITPYELMEEINRGLKVEGITRITGYFTKISSWNPGKLAELQDRRKFNI